MRQQVIQMLAYPRAVVRNELKPELWDCPHNGFFDEEDQRCVLCDNQPECQWLYSNDEFAALGQRNMEGLAEGLQFAVRYISALAAYLGHMSHTCQCEMCVWLRDAQRISDQLSID